MHTRSLTEMSGKTKSIEITNKDYRLRATDPGGDVM